MEGRLLLGLMPPMGGDLEPIGPLASRCEDIVPGSVYLAREEEGGAPRATEAFLRGAGGVVAAGPVAPHDGRFLIQVDDVEEAACRLGRWSRAVFGGKLVLTGPELDPDRLSQLFALPDPPPKMPIDCGASASISSLACAAAALFSHCDRDFSVLQLSNSGISKIDEISHLCCPHVVCIYTLPCGKQPVEQSRIDDLQDAFPDDGCLVTVEPSQHKVRLSRDWELVAREVQPNVFDFEGEQVAISPDHLPMGLACWGIATAMGLPFRDGLAQRISRVPA